MNGGSICDPAVQATKLGSVELSFFFTIINHIHNEESAKAIEELRSQQPLDATSASTAKRITLYYMICGRERHFVIEANSPTR